MSVSTQRGETAEEDDFIPRSPPFSSVPLHKLFDPEMVEPVGLGLSNYVWECFCAVFTCCVWVGQHLLLQRRLPKPRPRAGPPLLPAAVRRGLDLRLLRAQGEAGRGSVRALITFAFLAIVCRVCVSVCE